MTQHARKVAILVAGMAMGALAQQPEPAIQTLDEISVAGPQDRNRGRGPTLTYGPEVHTATVSVQNTVRISLAFAKQQTQVGFRRLSDARQLPASASYRTATGQQLELLPDRLVATVKHGISTAGLELAANVDEADGVPANIPFGEGLALVNLAHAQPDISEVRTRFFLINVLHPQIRSCQARAQIADLWSPGTMPFVLLGKSFRDCNRALKSREGELLYAESVPQQLRQAVQELYDPIASRLANRLGSEPGNMFVAWWPESPHEGHRLELGWGRTSLLLLNGLEWQQGLDTTQREMLRASFMREQLQRRISEADWPGPFTQSAVSYLLLLTHGDELQTTTQDVGRELPRWIAGCGARLQMDGSSTAAAAVEPGMECSMLVQFVYDAVARAESSGQENLYDTWRKLLDEAWRAGRSGTSPQEFMATSPSALQIVKRLVDGSVDWAEFAAAMSAVGVQLRAVPGAAGAEFEVVSLEHFGD